MPEKSPSEDKKHKPLIEPGAESSLIYGHTGIVTFFTLISRVLGMVRDLVISNRFGASGATDAWVQAFRIPNALRRLTAEGAMTIAFIPCYVRVREEEGAVAARIFSQRVLGLVLFSTLLLAGLGMIFSDQLTMLFSPGFIDHPEKFELTSLLIRSTFPYLVFVSIVAWAMGVLNSEGRFAAPAAAPIFLNVGIILSVIWISGYFSPQIIAVAAGVLAGGIAQVLLQGPSLLAIGVSPIPRMGWRDSQVRRLFGLLAPSILGVAVYEINIIILGVIASYLPTGQIFHYHNATRMTELVMGLFAFAFTTAGLPKLSEHQARGDWPRMSETINLTFSAVLYTVLPTMAGLMVAAPAVISMLFLHGAYTMEDALSTSETLRYLAVGMPAIASVRVMVPIYYALGNAATPVKISMATLVVTGFLGWTLSQQMEVQGLALGLSLGAWFQAVLLAVFLKLKGGELHDWFPWRATLQQAGASIVVGALAWWTIGFGEWQFGPFYGLNWLVFLLTAISGMGGYLMITLAIGEPQAGNWIGLVGRGLKRLHLFSE